jgi:hypothetical protein
MLAAVGHASPFDHGRQQIESLAGLKVTTKAVERTAEAIGRDILARQQQEIRRAKQLELPAVAEPRIPILCIQIDGTGVPVVIAETQGRQGKQPANPRIRAKPNSAASSPRPPPMQKVVRCATKAPPAMSAPLSLPRSSAYASTPKPGIAAGIAPSSRSSWETVQFGSGTSVTSTSPAPSKSWTLPRPRASMESRSQTVPQRCGSPKALGHGGTGQTRQRPHRKPAHLLACPPSRCAGSDRDGPHRGGVL